MSFDGLRIRAADVEDLSGVLGLERAVAEAPHWAEAEYVAMLEQDGEAGLVRRCLFVGEKDGKLVGFAVGKVVGAGAMAELESVAVDAAARRGGVGRELCGAVVDWCGVQGAKEVELEVRAGSAGAIALYRGLGFVAVGRRNGYYREPVEDAVLMRLELAEGK